MAIPPPPIHLLTDGAALLATSFGPLGTRLFPHAAPSHICIRTQDETQQAVVRDMAAQLGTLHTSMPAGKPVYWVQLDNPVAFPGGEFGWLEITGPKANPATGVNYPTGPQMLVFVDPAVTEPVLQPVFGSPTFVLRCQNISPTQILARA